MLAVDLISSGTHWRCYRPTPAYTSGHVFFEPADSSAESWGVCYREASNYGDAMVDFGLAKNYNVIATTDKIHVSLINGHENIVDFATFINLQPC